MTSITPTALTQALLEFSLVAADEFTAIANQAGFRIKKVYGDYGKAPYVPADSPHIIYVLTKEADAL